MDSKTAELSAPKKRIDYRETLLAIPVGESRRIKVMGKTYSGYTAAATRLRQYRGIDCRIESIDNSTILVTRHS